MLVLSDQLEGRSSKDPAVKTSGEAPGMSVGVPQTARDEQSTNDHEQASDHCLGANLFMRPGRRLADRR